MISAYLSFGALSLLASGALSASEPSRHFIVSCALLQAPAAADKVAVGKQPKSHTLNLLVGGAAAHPNFLGVIETYDPDKVAVGRPFIKAFAEGTNFVALTGDADKPETYALALRSRGNSEYDVMLSDVAHRQQVFRGRCWTSNIANADEEFQKLKDEDVSQ